MPRFMITLGRQGNSQFHEVTNANSDTVTIAGLIAGRQMRASSCQLE